MTATMVGGESCTHSRRRERGIRYTSRACWVHRERTSIFIFLLRFNIGNPEFHSPAYFRVDKRAGGNTPLVCEFICKSLKRGNASLINGSSWFTPLRINITNRWPNSFSFSFSRKINFINVTVWCTIPLLLWREMNALFASLNLIETAQFHADNRHKPRSKHLT